jgi:hypothetical protein
MHSKKFKKEKFNKKHTQDTMNLEIKLRSMFIRGSSSAIRI